MANCNSYVEIDEGILCGNIRSIREDLGPNCALIPVLKCDAYGLGMVAIARAICSAAPIQTIALAQVQEALALRQAGFRQNLFVMAGVPREQMAEALEQDVQLNVHSLEAAQWIEDAAKKLGKRARVHVKVDTGLSRLGCKPGAELAPLIDFLKTSDYLEISSVYSHFVDAETVDSPLALVQLARYQEALRQFEQAGLRVPLRHMCNSGASEWLPAAFFDAARIGRRLYMDSQTHPRPAGNRGAVGEVSSWRTQIVNLRLVRAGESVGYGQAYRAKSATMVATLGLGYGDGLDERLAHTGAPVLISEAGLNGKYLSICMDQSMIDVSDIPCRVGDEVTIWGRSSEGRLLSAQHVGSFIGHEAGSLSSRIGNRVERRYIRA